MAGVEDILGKHGNHHMRDKFKRFDNRFIRPFLLRNYQVSMISKDLTLLVDQFQPFIISIITRLITCFFYVMQGAEPKILETYSKLAMKDAIEYMQRNASTIGNISGAESMSAIFKNYTNANFNGR